MTISGAMNTVSPSPLTSLYQIAKAAGPKASQSVQGQGTGQEDILTISQEAIKAMEDLMALTNLLEKHHHHHPTVTYDLLTYATAMTSLQAQGQAQTQQAGAAQPSAGISASAVPGVGAGAGAGAGGGGASGGGGSAA